MMLLVLLVLGPIVDLTPIPSLAGLLLVVAVDLVDFKKIRAILSGDLGDKLAFTATLLGTWALSLDFAIYLGVGISLILFLRRARQVVIKELLPDGDRFREVEQGDEKGEGAIRILHVEGSLFFGAASELTEGIDSAIADPDVKVLIVRLKRTIGLDYTTAQVLEAAHARLHADGRHLFLVGLQPDALRLLERVGVAEKIGANKIYATRPGWFDAVESALRDAIELVGDEHIDPELTQYLERRAS